MNLFVLMSLFLLSFSAAAEKCSLSDTFYQMVKYEEPKKKKFFKSANDEALIFSKDKELQGIFKRMNTSFDSKDLSKEQKIQIFQDQRLIDMHNTAISEYAEMLRKDGVEVRVYDSTSSHGYKNIEIISVSESSPPVLKLYMRAAKRFGAREVTISIIDNVKGRSGAFFYPGTLRVDLGPSSFTTIFLNQKSLNPLHELRHLMNHAAEKEEKYSLFHGTFLASKKKLINGKDIDGYIKQGELPGIYDVEMSIDELYTYASDLWVYAKGAEKSLKLLREELPTELNNLHYLVQSTRSFLEEMRKSLAAGTKVEKSFSHFEIGSGLVLTDQYGRIMRIPLPKKYFAEAEKKLGIEASRSFLEKEIRTKHPDWGSVKEMDNMYLELKAKARSLLSDEEKKNLMIIESLKKASSRKQMGLDMEGESFFDIISKNYMMAVIKEMEEFAKNQDKNVKLIQNTLKQKNADPIKIRKMLVELGRQTRLQYKSSPYKNSLKVED